MKIRHPLAIQSAAFAASLWLRAWTASQRIDEQILDPDTDLRSSREHRIYLVWHENLLIPTAFYAKMNVSALISQHRDGELITQVLQFLGGTAVRGSSTRGGGKALRELIAALGQRHIAITPDGPRGPRRVLQQGAVFLASHCQRPIVPIGFHAPRAWRANSWDRFVVPKPFHRARIVIGKAVRIPPGLDKTSLEPWLKVCQQAMDETQSLAEAGQKKSPADSGRA